VLNFDYDIVQLNRLNWRDFLQQKNPVLKDTASHMAAALMELQEQEQIMQLTTSWEQKGIVKGRQEGQSNTILRLLHRKFGSLPSAISQQVKSLEPNQLDALTEDLLDFNSLDDLHSWLSHS
jgi:hypothetical protein